MNFNYLPFSLLISKATLQPTLLLFKLLYSDYSLHLCCCYCNVSTVVTSILHQVYIDLSKLQGIINCTLYLIYCCRLSSFSSFLFNTLTASRPCMTQLMNWQPISHQIYKPLFLSTSYLFCLYNSDIFNNFAIKFRSFYIGNTRRLIKYDLNVCIWYEFNPLLTAWMPIESQAHWRYHVALIYKIHP